MNKTQTEYGKLPKYKILYKWITDQIYNGTFKYMEKLPSESELCNQFQIVDKQYETPFKNWKQMASFPDPKEAEVSLQKK